MGLFPKGIIFTFFSISGTFTSKAYISTSGNFSEKRPAKRCKGRSFAFTLKVSDLYLPKRAGGVAVFANFLFKVTLVFVFGDQYLSGYRFFGKTPRLNAVKEGLLRLPWRFQLRIFQNVRWGRGVAVLEAKQSQFLGFWRDFSSSQCYFHSRAPQHYS